MEGKDVLHIGVGGAVDDAELKQAFLNSDVSSWFHARISASASSVTTLEMNQDNIDKFSKVVPGTYIRGDITDPEVLTRLPEKYELVVFTEIIEHLDCFRAALQNIHSLLGPRGEVVISTISAYNLFAFFRNFFWYEHNHTEHTAYFSYLTIKRVLQMNDFSIKRFYFAYDPTPNPLKRFIKRAMVRILPQFSQGIVVVAQASPQSP